MSLQGPQRLQQQGSYIWFQGPRQGDSRDHTGSWIRTFMRSLGSRLPTMSSNMNPTRQHFLVGRYMRMTWTFFHITLYYFILLYYITLYYIIYYYIILYYIMLYYIILYYIILYYIILYYIILYYIILYYSILCYTILYYITLYCTILFYIVLYNAILDSIVFFAIYRTRLQGSFYLLGLQSATSDGYRRAAVLLQTALPRVSNVPGSRAY